MKKTLSLVSVLILFVCMLAGCQNVTVDNQNHKYTYEQAVSNIRKLYDKVEAVSVDDPSIYDNGSAGFWFAEEDTSALLPDFFQGRQAAVSANKDDTNTAIVLSSTEKAVANDTDRWMIDAVIAYNSKPDRKGSITLFGQASGESFDYIRSGKFVPDMWTPSNRLWGDALGYTPDYDRLAGNVAGIVSKEGLDISGVISGVESSTVQFGYTNPLASSTGANFLLDYLYNQRGHGEFSAFQRNIALVSYTTPQMRTAALSGKLDAFVYESQQFETGVIDVNGKKTTLSDMYKFVPFGVRHDNPVYILNESKRELLEDFSEFCLSSEMQNLATKYGFNQYDDYRGADMSGATLQADQRHYRENKTGGRPVVSVFVCDVSGSMNGTPLSELKSSLRSSAGVIPQDNYVGFVTFSTDVRVALPIAQFDDTTRDRFLEATNQLTAGGGTAIFSSLVVASQQIIEHKEANPNLDALYRIFLLTDGENTDGLTKSSTLDTLGALGIPIYCIGYNDGSSDLDALAGLNEAAHVKINDQNVGYALANFFKAEF